MFSSPQFAVNIARSFYLLPRSSLIVWDETPIGIDTSMVAELLVGTIMAEPIRSVVRRYWWAWRHCQHQHQVEEVGETGREFVALVVFIAAPLHAGPTAPKATQILKCRRAQGLLSEEVKRQLFLFLIFRSPTPKASASVFF